MISFIVIGFVTLVAFVLWECYKPLKEPFVPMKLFKDGESIYRPLQIQAIDTRTQVSGARLVCSSESVLVYT